MLFFTSVPEEQLLRRGNIMARTRMVLLYDISARDGRLVAGTSNKTELLLGYGTMFGDMASAINPIGDLYKTQIRGLARHLGIPEQLIVKAPSADLWEGQSDEADLGFSYEAVDLLLYMMLERRMDKKALLDKGIPEPFYDRVRKMVVRNQYKTDDAGYRQDFRPDSRHRFPICERLAGSEVAMPSLKRAQYRVDQKMFVICSGIIGCIMQSS